ncbi:primosomal protein N' [Nocardia sp. NBC_01503]|uniref:primosomal protein N' family DNA-binding protein n=1 Tax=Nocardia sp. NBC_01503 TaxID=2975997 RepID=UPI002E7BA060|nr:primosomal protein N' [Nocardia sp. NBC_01503]WTL36454.1 primosomal protein N' [Nocardia sp. NBC_01503]
MARVLPLLEPAHLDRDFDYLVPAELDAEAQPGVRVRVRFSGRLIDGYLLERLEKTDHAGKLVRLERVVSPEPVLTPEILRLVTAVAARYAGTRADVLRLAIPPRHAKTEAEGSTPKPASAKKRRTKAAAAERLAAEPAPVELDGPVEAAPSANAESDETRAASSAPATTPGSSAQTPSTSESDSRTADSETTALTFVTESTDSTDMPGMAVSSNPAEDSDASEVPAGHSTSTAAGSTAAPEDETPDAGVSTVDAGDASAIVAGDAATGSATAEEADKPGVSELYPGWGRYAHGHSFLAALAAGRGPRAAWQALPGDEWARRLAELAATVVGSGRSAIVMVPDQRDLDRVLTECVALVGESAVGLAAGLGPSARYRRWLAALRGTARVVVGTRSSVFTPVKDLGLIAMWDDGDDTYAEPRSPYPHAREVAMLRVHETGAAFVAGGFARTAEIQAVVESGWAHDLLADRSVLRQVMPRLIAPGDTDAALERDPMARAIRIPAAAFMAARRALAAGEPVLVQVPRRGYIPALSCSKCRTPARCRHCNGPLALPDNNTHAAPPAGTGGSARAAGGGVAAPQQRGSGSRGDDFARPSRNIAPQEQLSWGRESEQRGRGSGAQPRRDRVDLGVAVGVGVPRGGAEVAHSPACRWCGITEAAFRCGTCGSRALRAVVIGAQRTAEELGRAFPGVPVRGSGGSTVLSSVPEGPQVVVSTIGAEPVVPGGYSVAMLLDGWALLGRADLRAAEDAMRRWMSAAALVRPSGQVIVMADPALATVQAFLRWDPVGHAYFELSERTEVRFPPAVRLAAIDGTTDSIAELLTEAKLPEEVEVLGPVPLPPGARKPFSSGDSPAEVERMILRVDRSAGSALSRALSIAQAVRSTHKSDDPLRVQIDPVDIG